MFKQIVISVILASLLAVFTIAQEQPTSDKKDKKECVKNCCSGHDSHMSMTMANIDSDSTLNEHYHMKSEEANEFSIVRQGEIDLAAIDLNGDEKVYQDQMCWNVISDGPGECPQCGMILKEVSLEQAKENLIKHDYKAKESK